MKRAAALTIAVALAALALIHMAFKSEEQPLDKAVVNEAVQEAMQSGSVEESVDSLSDWLAGAYQDLDASRRSRDKALQAYLYIIVGASALAGLLLCWYCERNYLRPFRELRSFARHVAAGNYDMPLEMDKHNAFGAFTESFDLLRDELKVARESELAANQQKKELVASLSHDIKTPIASIMSAMDIMLVRAKDDKEKKAVESVILKLEQIDSLVTNLFHSTLEELQALEVTPVEVQSVAIPALIHNADYEQKVQAFAMPSCIVLADPLRLQQVFDNVVHNSYKYAQTAIAIEPRIEEGYLAIDINDYGPGVLDDELPRLSGKYFRGSNAQESDGYGLGLFVSTYFMEQMAGALSCANRADGFTVSLRLKLA